MNKLKYLALALAVGSIPVVYGQTPPAEPPTGDPETASSPHQRETTKESSSEAPATTSPEPGSASSPHQRETVDQKSSGDTKMASAGEYGSADPAMFVKKAAQGGMTEVELGKLAVGKAQDAQVRAFAQRMVKDHSAANEQLASLAKRKGWSVPTSLDSKHQGMVKTLSAKSGADFDVAYSQQMMADHEKAIALFESATRSPDADLASWAKKTLPTLEEHQRLAAELPGASEHSSSSTGQRD